MHLYIVNLNGKTTTYMRIEDIPFEMSQDKVEELYKTTLIRFFTKDGEVTILFSQDNENIYHEVYKNPKPLEKDGYISISHYNSNKKLHTNSKDIPSVLNTLIDRVDCHKNGKNISIKKELFKDDYGEYTLLNKISKEFKEVRCYSDGFRQYIKNNGDTQWRLNKELHSPNKETPALISYFDNGSLRSESYYINGEYHRKDGPATIEYYRDASIHSQLFYVNGKRHREDGPAHIYYNTDGSISYKEYYINNELHREDGPAIVEYYPNDFIRYEGYYINGKLHREDGPACIYYFEDGQMRVQEYYLNNKRESPSSVFCINN
jgi:antitoxin component YwqK of YwqJK toxin-antitoxin module